MGTDVVEELRQEIRGKVIAPGEPGYDRARTVVPGDIDRRPAVIARAADTADVARVLGVARGTGMKLAVRCGGHSAAGHGVCQDGIVLDLRDMRGLRIDAGEREAWAETGLTAAGYTAEAAKHGLATGFGDTGSVGIGGITLGGGIGLLVRKHGLTIDSLLAAEVVTADGEVLQTDEKTHPDLFWAIRGGGGNFGVVTRFRFRLHELPSVVGGLLVLPATPEGVAAFMAEAQEAPEELSVIANVMPAPPMPFLPTEQHGRPIIMAIMVYAGPTEAGQRALAPFRGIATPLADMLRPTSYAEVFQPDDDDYHPLAVAHTMFMDTVDQGVARTILDRLEASDAPLRVTQLRALGGAASRVAPEATAFAHRRSRIMANVASFYIGPDDLPRREAWVRDLAGALRQTDAGAYVNFLGDEGEARVRRAYPGATWDRLTKIKRRYDPTNLFRLNQNVPPAAS